MANINFESKVMEQIQVELARDIFKGVRGHIEEAITMAIGERWEDIFRAVIAAQPAPAVVSNDKLIEDLEAELAVLREENFQLQASIIGMSCKLPHCPVKAMEAAGVLTVDEELSVVQQATEEALAVIATMEPQKSLMEEAMEPMSEIEESFWEPQEDELLNNNPNEDLENEMSLLPDEEDEDPFAGAVVISEPEQEEEEEVFNPFAGATVIDEEEVHDALVGDEEFNHFTSSDDVESFVPEFSDSDMPPVPDFEAEEESKPAVETKAPSIPTQSPINTSIPAVNPLGKNDTTMVTYDVFGKEVTMIQKNAMIKSVKNGHVRKMAFQLNDVMAKGNSRYKGDESEKQMGKFYTQMIREWALEIAAANNIEQIKGDSGAAILIAELFYSMHTENQNLYSPQLRARNEAERLKAIDSYRMLNADATRQACLDLVNVHKGPLALDPMMFVGDKADTKEKIAQAGYALLHARMSLTWENAMGKTACVFPEVKKDVLKGGVSQ